MKQKDLLYLFMSCFIVVAAWVGFHIYNIYVTSTVSQDLQEQSQPINASFDTGLIANLRTRLQVSPQYEASSPVTPTPSASSSALPTINGQ